MITNALIPLPFLNKACTSRNSRFTYCWSLAWRILGIILLACEMSAICGSLNILWLLPFLGLEEMAEAFLVHLFEDVYFFSWHADHLMLFPEDVQLARGDPKHLGNALLSSWHWPMSPVDTRDSAHSWDQNHAVQAAACLDLSQSRLCILLSSKVFFFFFF